MEHEFKPIPGAAGFQLSNPPLLPTMSLLGALNVFAKTSMKRLRTKSKLLTAYLELLLLYHFGNPDNEGEILTKRQQLQNGKSPRNNIHVSIVTPINPSERGCQLSVKFSMRIKSVHDELEKRGVVVDTREPDVMRIAPAPLYNSFMNVYRFVTILGEAIDALECGESEK